MATLPVTITVRRGLKANLPTSAPDGELFFCRDTHEMFVGTGTGMVPLSAAGAATAFSTILDGENTFADMRVGPGAELRSTGGLIDATKINGVPITGTPTLGKIPIGQPDGSAVWADPFVQGTYAPGTNADTGGIGGGPINPVLMGVRDGSGVLRDLAGDADGKLSVTATLSAETNKVIGTVNIASGQKVGLDAGSAVIGHVIVDSAGNVAITSLPSLPAGSNVIGHVIVDSGTLTVTEENLDDAIVSQGTVASTKLLMIGGKSNDGTPQYRELPLGGSARSVIVEGLMDGVAIPVTGPLTDTQLRASAVPVSGPLTDTQLRATSVPVVLNAETTKVIGTVRVASGQTIGLDAGTQVIGHVIVDSAGSVSIVALPALPAGSNVIGQVGIDQTTPGTSNKVNIGSDGVVALAAGSQVIGHVVVDSDASVDALSITPGTTAPGKIIIIGGKSNDGTPQYKEIPLGTSARSVIIEGVASGTAVPVSISGNQGVNIAQINGNTVVTAADGVQRVGVTDDAGNAITSNSTTTSSKRALDINLLSVLGTALAVNTGNASAGVLRVVLATDQPQLTNALKTQTIPGTSGGASSHNGESAGTAVAIKASSGQLYGCELGNPNVGWLYCQVYNVAAASVTVGTTSPVRSIPIPPNTSLTRDWSQGLAFTTAMSYAFTTSRTGSGVPASNGVANFDFA